MLAARLTPEGWERYRELGSSGVGSRQAFMAMRFRDPLSDSVLADYFTSAVRDAGFDLRTVFDGQPAGLVDDRILVGISYRTFCLLRFNTW
jgi:hypothetical protein